MLEGQGRRRAIGVLAVLLLLGMAQAASAGTISRSGTSWSYVDSDSGANTFDVDFCVFPGCAGDENRFIFRDTADTMVVPTTLGCSSTGTVAAGTAVGCPVGGVTPWTVSLGGGNDTFTIDGQGRVGTFTFTTTVDMGPGDDSVTGGRVPTPSTVVPTATPSTVAPAASTRSTTPAGAAAST